MTCVECLPILGCLVKGREDWLYCDDSGDINIDLSCSGHTGQTSIIANGVWSSFIVLSLRVPFLHYFNIKMTNENLNIFRYKDLSECRIFLKIFSIMGRKFLYKTDFSVEKFSFSLLCQCLFCLAITAFCYGLSGCCSCMCKRPGFQGEASLSFTLLRNGKFSCYSRCVDRGCPGVKVKNSSFISLVHFPGQNWWIWVWSNQMLLLPVLQQPLLSALSLLFIHTFGK